LLPVKCKAGNALLYVKTPVFFKVFQGENRYPEKATGYEIIPAGFEFGAVLQ
jgi:hypothetical protein